MQVAKERAGNYLWHDCTECENKVTDEGGSELSLFAMALSKNLVSFSFPFMSFCSLGSQALGQCYEIWT